MHALGRNATFTGRTQIWEHINIDTVNPLFGSGYWNFWGGPGGERINQEMQSLIPNAHNGYLDIYLDGGAIAGNITTPRSVHFWNANRWKCSCGKDSGSFLANVGCWSD